MWATEEQRPELESPSPLDKPSHSESLLSPLNLNLILLADLQSIRVPSLGTLDSPVPASVVDLPLLVGTARVEQLLSGGIDSGEGLGAGEIPAEETLSGSSDDAGAECGGFSHLRSVDGYAENVRLQG